jgi:eukaryotic-like serine/threonine-protein kinase
MRTLGDIKLGQTIGRYEFLIPIAEGGMAEVWAARLKGTRGFQKTLAIKTMLSSLGTPGKSHEAFEEMFLNEARIASRIRHPNVVEIFDLGEEDDVLFIVMEWVDGEPLSTISRAAQKKGQSIPLPLAIRIAADALAGLHAAHELRDDDNKPIGLVHRDVSPQNIVISYDGATKIVDFGVAMQGRESERTGTDEKVKGKVPYMSPEQALGKPIDRRTDIFAMGIILYQLTTGRHPFRSDSDIATLRNILDQPADPPSLHVSGFPRPLEQALLKALDKDPNNRFQTAAEFEAALDRALPPSAPRVRTSDIAKFVRDTVGERGERRREAIRSAVKQADEMLGSSDSLPAARLGSQHALGSGQHPATNPTGQGLSASTPPPAFVEEAPAGRGKIAALGVLVVVAAVVVGALALRPRSQGPRGTGIGTPAGPGGDVTAPVESNAGTTPSASASTTDPPPATSTSAAPTPSAETPPPVGDAVDLDALPADQRHWKKGGVKIPGAETAAPEPPPTAPPEPPPPATATAKPPHPKSTGAVPPITDPGF